MELTGKIEKIFDTVTISEKFKKREFVIKTEESYNDKVFENYIIMNMTQDKTKALDVFKVGQDVTVAFNVKGVKYEKDGETRYFNNLQAWRIDPQHPQVNEAGDDIDATSDGLPF